MTETELVAQGIGLLLVSVLVWLVCMHKSRFRSMTDRLPGPKALPILGNVLDLMDGHEVFIKVIHTKWVNAYGELFKIYIGTGCYVVISSAELIEPLLKSQKYIEKGLSYDQFIPWLGRGLLTNYGEKWKIRRRLLTPSFHFDILNNFLEIFNEQSKVFAKILSEKSQSNGGKPIEISALATRCTLDIICESAMGTKINCQIIESDFSASVSRINEIMLEQFQKPWLMYPVVSKLSSLGKDFDRVLKVVNNFSDEVIYKRRTYLDDRTKNLENKEWDQEKSQKKKRLALLDLLLSLSEGGQALSHEEIRHEGHDTTSALIGWFLFMMASHPEHQKKVHEELCDVFGDSDRHCKQEDLPNLKYLECCIKETLRLYPSAPEFERLAIDDVTLGEYVIPKGCSILVSVYALHRNAKYFNDPLSFLPERFCTEESCCRHPFSYIPFSAGPRNCIGQRFAMLEAKVILSTLLRHLSFEITADCPPPKPCSQIVLKSLNGIHLVVKSKC